MRRWTMIPAACAVVLGSFGVALGGTTDRIESVDLSATALRPATRVAMPVDAISVYNVSTLVPSTEAAARQAAADVGAIAVVGRGFSIGLHRVTRSGAVIQQASVTPGGLWAFPMGVTALPIEAIGAVLGGAVSGSMAGGAVVMSETSASLRGAQAGDEILLLAVSGAPVAFTIGRVAPDAEVGGSEIVMTTAQADQLGAVVPTRLLIYGAMDHTAADAALAAHGLTSDPKIRVRRSWDVPDPDATIGMGRTKQLLGEFDYLASGGSSVSIDPGWEASHLPAQREALPTGIVARCHLAIGADLRAALQEVSSAGLAGTFDLADTNTNGGCFNPRFNRVTGNLGSLSRHTWAQAIDINPTSSCLGCVPKIDCRIVRIFREHNFAWGGNFLSSDGMHFEWVGEPRNTLQYPSRYCPNLADGRIESFGPTTTNAATMFADDGWFGADQE